MLRRCAYRACGRMFETANVRRLFCCERCRRAGQNEARRSARAEAREARENARPMADPWERLPADEWEAEELWANALLDALPAGLTDAAPLPAACPAPVRNAGAPGTLRGCGSRSSASARRGGAATAARTRCAGGKDQLFPSA